MRRRRRRKSRRKMGEEGEKYAASLSNGMIVNQRKTFCFSLRLPSN